jgi:hypothetical protein
LADVLVLAETGLTVNDMETTSVYWVVELAARVYRPAAHGVVLKSKGSIGWRWVRPVRPTSSGTRWRFS